MSYQIQQTEIRGLPTAWIAEGPAANAPIMLLLHGYPDTAECWDAQIEAFKASYLVIAPFMRGAGPSAKAAKLGRYTPDAMALDVLAILDHVDPSRERPLFIVGHDLGVVHAWHLAELLQDRVKSLVVINGLTIPQLLRRWKQPQQYWRSWYIGLMQLPLVPETLAAVAPQRLMSFAYRQGGFTPASPGWAGATAADTATDPLMTSDSGAARTALIGPHNQYRAFFRQIPRELWRGIRRGVRRRLGCPVLVLWGADDAFLEPPTRHEIAADAADVTLRILPANHWLHRTEAASVNKLIGDFCRERGGLPC